jgi:hypothetical protein
MEGGDDSLKKGHRLAGHASCRSPELGRGGELAKKQSTTKEDFAGCSGEEHRWVNCLVSMASCEQQEGDQNGGQ